MDNLPCLPLPHPLALSPIPALGFLRSLKDRKTKYYLGAWSPPEQPAVFFEPVPVKEDYRYIYFEPRFRLPLFQTVQQSVFGGQIEVVANLRAGDFRYGDVMVPKEGLVVVRRDSGRESVYIPQ